MRTCELSRLAAAGVATGDHVRESCCRVSITDRDRSRTVKQAHQKKPRFHSSTGSITLSKMWQPA